MKVIVISDFKNRIKSYLASLEKSQDSIILKQSGQKKFVVIPISQYNSMMETLHLLSTTANSKRLMESIEQHENSFEQSRLTLNKEDGEFLANMLNNPPEPSERLRKKIAKTKWASKVQMSNEVYTHLLT